MDDTLCLANTSKGNPCKKMKISEHYCRIHTTNEICCTCGSNVISSTESILKISGRSLCRTCIEDECIEILTQCEDILVQRRYVKRKTNEFMQLLETLYS